MGNEPSEIKTVILAGIAFLAVYSFLGWLLEVAYRSWSQRRFVNAGFLFGPFVPIYGLGALLVVGLGWSLGSAPLPVRFLVLGLTLTLLEYGVGALAEWMFSLKLWDYSDSKWSLRGRVSLPYSVLWAALATAGERFLHPQVNSLVERFSNQELSVFSALFFLYVLVDASFSIALLQGFRRRLALLMANYATMTNMDFERLFETFHRLLGAFPDLNRALNQNLTENLKGKVGGLLTSMTSKVWEEIQSRRPEDQEYFALVADILENTEFRRLAEFFHHNSSILDHVQRVSYLSYRIAKYLGLDHRAAARGGLLHDFFLYDWRNHHEPDLAHEKFHGLHHPSIALKNAQKHFVLTDIEKDIILKHMWPLTLRPPSYRESFVVTFVDKFLSSKEFVGEFAKQAVGLVERRGPHASK